MEIVTQSAYDIVMKMVKDIAERGSGRSQSTLTAGPSNVHNMIISQSLLGR